MPGVKQPSFRWTEPPRWLPLPADELGAAFARFMQTNSSGGHSFDFKPVAELSTPTLPVEPAPVQNSTMQIEGELAQRQLPAEISLTNWPYAAVLAPCVVQVLVDAAGNVVSTVVLPPERLRCRRSTTADQRALEIARALRFTPSSRCSLLAASFSTGETVPPTLSAVICPPPGSS